MKKIFALICAGIIACSLTACGGGEVADTTDADVTATQKADIETAGDALEDDKSSEDANADASQDAQTSTDAATDTATDTEADTTDTEATAE